MVHNLKVGDKVSIVAHDGSVQPAQVTRVQPDDGGFGAALPAGELGGDRWFLFSAEGLTWVPGWDDSASDALRTVAVLREDGAQDVPTQLAMMSAVGQLKDS